MLATLPARQGMRFLNAYTRSFERRPYLTLLITNGVLMGLGDCSAQLFFSGPVAAAWDIVRTARFAFFGASMGPLAGAWNKLLEVNFPLRKIADPIEMSKVRVEQQTSPIPGFKLPPGSRLERGGAVPAATASAAGGKDEPISTFMLFKRVAADQLIMAPISLFIFLFSMSLLEGLDGDQTSERIRTNYWSILSVNWMVIWPVLQAFNFRYVPLKYRVPFGACLGILWTGFLSLKTQKTIPLVEAI